MKVAIDCRCLRKQPSGIPNATVTIINNLSKELPDVEFHLISNAEFHTDIDKKLEKRKNIVLHIDPLFLFKNIAILWYLIKASSILRKIKPDFFIASSFLVPPSIPKKLKNIVIIHDLVYKKHPETMSFSNRLIFKILHNYSVRKADVIWTFSNYTYQEFIRFYPEMLNKPRFTGFGIEWKKFNLNFPDSEKESLIKKYDIGEKFLLFVGTLEPRKNLQFMLSLMPELSRKGFHLLIVGAKGWGKSNLEGIMNSPGFPVNHVRFTGYISDEELVKIYKFATVYISTSLNEGLGMPQLEAMSAGCPVVSPHNSAMIEVVENAGKTVAGWNKADWISTILKAADNRQKYSESGKKRAEQYRWEVIAEEFNSKVLKDLV